MRPAYLKSALPGKTPRQGKVRDLYEFGDRLLVVASDRISAFDWVLPTGIPDKGRVLTQLSAVWFELLDVENHLLDLDPRAVDLPAGTDVEALVGRTMVVRRAKVYKVCGVVLPAGLQESDRLPAPIFTPATKEESGHDINIPFERMAEIVGRSTADELRRMSLSIYQQASEYAAARGILLADTKFEFGEFEGRPILIDEVLTPDSSRFWPANQYEPGHGQPSFDKQFVRDWLETTGWDKNSPPPALPNEVVTRTREKYIEAYELLSGKAFAWK
ncbi:MAG: phosphoribosylaminoimidazolesuccinocarboxamide synthase [Planctomycetota bacterium]|nr:phosphoribosylaminoimidazolesuccinocarboxamide synthase [Planctomycetota bacterium]